LYLYIIHSGYESIRSRSRSVDIEAETEIAEDEDLNDPYYWASSRASTPLESVDDNNTEEVFEVSDEDDDVPEKPAESAQAELSTQSSLLCCATH
jgi:hypothetical protein